MTEFPTQLKNQLDSLIEQYANLFCAKHDLKFLGWSTFFSGKLGQFSEYLFQFEDIRLDLETNQPKQRIIEWYNITIDGSGPNYETFIQKQQEKETTHTT